MVPDMDSTVISSFVGTEVFNRLLQRPEDTLVQHILVQRDLIREFKTANQHHEDEVVDTLRDELSYIYTKISELEEDLAEARDIINQMAEGNVTEWDT
jgi:hypothetical protein